MVEFLTGLVLGLAFLLVVRRRWTNATELQEARMRGIEDDAEALTRFAGGLLALACTGKDTDSLVSGVVSLLTSGVGATSGVFYVKEGENSLRRVAVEGMHPLQGTLGADHSTRAAAVAEALGPETITVGEGLVGQSARTRTTIRKDADPGEPLAQVAIPVFDSGNFVGVVALAGPVSGGAFSDRAVALAERFVAGAGSALGQSTRGGSQAGIAPS